MFLICYFLFRISFHPGMSRAFLLPYAIGSSVLPPVKYDTIIRRQRLEVAISRLKKEKELLQVDCGEFPVLHIPDEKLLA